MYEWEVFTAENRIELQSILNSITKSGWEVFQVIPTLAFSDRKIMMVQVPMPGEVQFEIIARKHGVQEE